MLDAFVNLFTRRDPKREAALALTRIMNRYDMGRLGYQEGISPDRRSNERHVALGVWLFPCGPDDDASEIVISRGVPAVTHDLRSEGFGIMTPVRMNHENYFVATQDEDNWHFFRCHVRHNTRKPGGWFQLGLQVDCAIDLDSNHRGKFRSHINAIEAGV